MDAHETGAGQAVSTPGVGLSRLAGAKVFLGNRWAALADGQKLRLLASSVAFLVLVAGVMWWAWRPNWRVLYSGLSPDDARQLGAVLTTANLTYDVSPDGTVLRVPAEEIDKARLTTAGKAGGKNGRAGFELFDKPDWAGSDFDEKVNYQRALEGELEHTIDTLEEVRSARVHLVLAHDSLFTEQQRDAKASVVLRLKTRLLPPDAAESIKNLVASAVDDLDPARVVLMDADGHALLGSGNESNAKAVYEQTLAEHILETLEPVVGEGNVRATVNVDYDRSSRDEVDENYDPSAVVTLSMQRAEQVSGAQPPAQGVPGTASNAPNQQVPLFPAQKPDAESTKQESGTYGASKKTRHLVEGPGEVSRITAAVLINDRLPVETGQPGKPANKGDKKQTVAAQPWSAEEMKQFASLAQAAVGYEEARGDRVVVENLRFDTSPPTSPGWLPRLLAEAGTAEPLARDGVLVVVAAMVLLLVVRPAFKMVERQAAEPRLLATATRSDALPAGGDAHAILEEQAQGVFEEVVSHIQRDPVQSARVLQTWIRQP
jgi:flagellar M-ring protein FliF